jgi:hypothetical protein
MAQHIHDAISRAQRRIDNAVILRKRLQAGSKRPQAALPGLPVPWSMLGAAGNGGNDVEHRFGAVLCYRSGCCFGRAADLCDTTHQHTVR